MHTRFLDLSAPSRDRQALASCPAARLGSGSTAPGSAAERVLAAELSGRESGGDALAMMVSSMLHMVQTGRGNGSRWKAR